MNSPPYDAAAQRRASWRSSPFDERLHQGLALVVEAAGGLEQQAQVVAGPPLVDVEDEPISSHRQRHSEPPQHVKGGLGAARLTTAELGDVDPDALRQHGLGEAGHEHFNGSLVVPVHDEAGAVVELYGRKGDGQAAQGDADPPLPARSPPGVFKVEALAAGDEVIVCESLIDAMTFWAAGYRHVTI